MTPLELNILLHYYAAADDVVNLCAPAVDKIIERFVLNGLLISEAQIAAMGYTHYNTTGDVLWHMTRKGRCYVDAILEVTADVQLPEYWCKKRLIPGTSEMVDQEEAISRGQAPSTFSSSLHPKGAD